MANNNPSNANNPNPNNPSSNNNNNPRAPQDYFHQQQQPRAPVADMGEGAFVRQGKVGGAGVAVSVAAGAGGGFRVVVDVSAGVVGVGREGDAAAALGGAAAGVGADEGGGSDNETIQGDDSSSSSDLREVDEDVDDEPWDSDASTARDSDDGSSDAMEVVAVAALSASRPARRHLALPPRFGGDAHHSDADMAQGEAASAAARTQPPPREEEPLFHRMVAHLGQAQPPVYVRCPICTTTQLSIRGLEIYEPEDENEQAGLLELAPGTVLICGHMVCTPCWTQHVAVQRGEGSAGLEHWSDEEEEEDEAMEGEVGAAGEEGDWEDVDEEDQVGSEGEQGAKASPSASLPDLVAIANDAGPPPINLAAPIQAPNNRPFLEPFAPLTCPLCRAVLQHPACGCDVETNEMPTHPSDPCASILYRAVWVDTPYGEDGWADRFPRPLNDGGHIADWCGECSGWSEEED